MDTEWFKDKVVVVQGLGLNQGGVGAVKFLAGKVKKFIITDLRDARTLSPSLEQIKKELSLSNTLLVLGKHREQDFKEADIVIKNPAVPPGNKYVEIARQKGAKVFTEVSLFMTLYKGVTVGITGTKGKSTTTSLVYHLLKNLLPTKKIILGGNIGKSVLTSLKENPDIAVLEISSFVGDSLNELKISPNVSVLTNLYVDHINWHKSFDHYKESKKALFKYQKANDLAVVNLDSKYVDEFLKTTNAYKVGVTLGNNFTAHSLTDEIYTLKKDKIIYQVKRQRELLEIPEDIKLKGKHNLGNILLAIAVAVEYFEVESSKIPDLLRSYTPLHGRQEYVATIDGIDFYNDTAATVDIAAIRACERFGKEYEGVVFIMGGVDKGIDYKALSKALSQNVDTVILFEGTASEKLKSELNKQNKVKVKGFFGDINKAVSEAYQEALNLKKDRKKVCVVLCPAAASFNMFLNEWDRGEKYINAVKKLGYN